MFYLENAVEKLFGGYPFFNQRKIIWHEWFRSNSKNFCVDECLYKFLFGLYFLQPSENFLEGYFEGFPI